MKQFFKELLVYNHQFNQQLGDVYNDQQESTSTKSVKLYCHMLNAHQIWNNRIEPKQRTFGVWDIHQIQDCKEIDKMNLTDSLVILDKFGLNEIISYTNNRGDTFRNSIRDILFHVIIIPLITVRKSQLNSN